MTKKSKLARSLLDPQRVANVILTVAEQDNPKLHNKVGIDCHVYSWARRWFPDFLWQFFLRKVYN